MCILQLTKEIVMRKLVAVAAIIIAITAGYLPKQRPMVKENTATIIAALAQCIIDSKDDRQNLMK